MHLSIQMQAQQRAELLVQKWAKQAGVQIEYVHYHLLRNALILQNIQMHQDNDTVTIKHILVRMNPESLNGPTPHIRLLEISGLNIEIHQHSEHPTWLENRALMKIWQATSSLHVQHGEVKLFSQQDDLMPLVITNISIKQQLQSGIRSMSASAKLRHGALQWEINTNQQHNSSSGRFSWQHVDTRQLTDILALEPLKGHLNGELRWHESDPENEPDTGTNIEGELHFLSGDKSTNEIDHSQEMHPLHHLQLSASQNNSIWSISLHAKAWPLSPWSAFIPKLGDHQLRTAQWDGSVHWQGVEGDWHIYGPAGIIQHISLAPVDHLNSPKPANNNIWSWQQLSYKNFKLNTSQHHFMLSQVKMHGGNISFDTTLRDHTAPQTPPPAQRPWYISADKVLIDSMTLNIALPGGELTLPSLRGSGSWSKLQHIKFDLETEDQKNSSDTNWHLHGSVTNDVGMQRPDTKISVAAKNIPMTSLRPLLALQPDTGSPITLSGRVNLQSTIAINQGQWHMQGRASGIDIQVSHAGDIWMAEKVDIRFGPIGTALKVQHVHQIQAENWSYIAALAPLQPTPHEPIIQQRPWWAEALHTKGVQIDQLHMLNGSLSIGQKESLWAEDINIHMGNLAANTWSSITAKAEVGSGLFELSGEWDAISQPQRFSGSVSLQHALPFFLQPWMRASGMPRLIRGYLNASIDITHNTEDDYYQALWQLQLLRTLAEDENVKNDPILARLGLNTGDLIAHLKGPDDTIKLYGEMAGAWQQQPLNFDMVGKSLQSSLHQAILQQSSRQPSKTEEEGQTAPDNSLMTTQLNTQIRLHGRNPLSLNERSRLYNVVKLLHSKPHMSIDLRPQWSGNQLNHETIAKIERTQQLIRRYMVYRHIDQQRIFPRWPTASDQVQGTSSIQIDLNN